MPRGKIDPSDLAESFAQDSQEMSFKPLFSKADANQCIPSGCTILNLVLSGRVDGGWLQGRIGRVIGGSDTGKTLLCLSAPAEIANSADPRFAEYDCYYDDPEPVDFDLTQWGKLASRLKSPGDDSSYYAEEFYSTVYELLKSSRPFVYVLDSLDALESKASVALFEKNQKELQKGAELSASYGDGKAAIHSKNLRKVKYGLKNTKSVMLLVSQVRDAMGTMVFGEGLTTAGGKALKYYSCYQVWLAKKEDMTRSVAGKPRKVGLLTRIRVDKNHATGKHLDFDMPIYYGWGIDDERCSLRWLTEQGFWAKDGQKINTKGFIPDRLSEKELSSLLRKDKDLNLKFLAFLQSSWDDLEKQIRRPNRYSGIESYDNDAD
jgi:RecA/RadA recombinase